MKRVEYPYLEGCILEAVVSDLKKRIEEKRTATTEGTPSLYIKTSALKPVATPSAFRSQNAQGSETPQTRQSDVHFHTIESKP